MEILFREPLGLRRDLDLLALRRVLDPGPDLLTLRRDLDPDLLTLRRDLDPDLLTLRRDLDPGPDLLTLRRDLDPSIDLRCLRRDIDLTGVLILLRVLNSVPYLTILEYTVIIILLYT